MTDQDQPVIPAGGSHRPAAVSVRLVCPPDMMAAAPVSLADFYGDARQPSTRRPSRSSDGQLLCGTLIVPVPIPGSPGPSMYPQIPSGDQVSETAGLGQLAAMIADLDGGPGALPSSRSRSPARPATKRPWPSPQPSSAPPNCRRT